MAAMCFQDIPAATRIAKEIMARAVAVEKLGWSRMSPHISAVFQSAGARPVQLSIRASFREAAQARWTMRASFANSEGCSENMARLIHLLAPLIEPTERDATVNAKRPMATQ
jgi:hypothetical protein